MASEIGELPVTVNQWRHRGAIPPRYWPKIIAAAVARGRALSADDLLAAHVPAAQPTPASAA